MKKVKILSAVFLSFILGLTSFLGEASAKSSSNSVPCILWAKYPYEIYNGTFRSIQPENIKASFPIIYLHNHVNKNTFVMEFSVNKNNQKTFFSIVGKATLKGNTGTVFYTNTLTKKVIGKGTITLNDRKTMTLTFAPFNIKPLDSYSSVLPGKMKFVKPDIISY